jgi:hypothetical protein
MFAMLPVIVRFPASVDAIASTSHPVCGFAKFSTSDFKSITAGTLLVTARKTYLGLALDAKPSFMIRRASTASILIARPMRTQRIRPAFTSRRSVQ